MIHDVVKNSIINIEDVGIKNVFTTVSYGIIIECALVVFRSITAAE